MWHLGDNKGRADTDGDCGSKNSVGVTYLVVQWFRLRTAEAGGMGLIPCQGTKIPTCYAAQPKDLKKKKFC